MAHSPQRTISASWKYASRSPGGAAASESTACLSATPSTACNPANTAPASTVAAVPTRVTTAGVPAARNADSRTTKPTSSTTPAANWPRWTAIQLSEAAYSAKTCAWSFGASRCACWVVTAYSATAPPRISAVPARAASGVAGAAIRPGRVAVLIPGLLGSPVGVVVGTQDHDQGHGGEHQHVTPDDDRVGADHAGPVGHQQDGEGQVHRGRHL